MMFFCYQDVSHNLKVFLVGSFYVKYMRNTITYSNQHKGLRALCRDKSHQPAICGAPHAHLYTSSFLRSLPLFLFIPAYLFLYLMPLSPCIALQAMDSTQTQGPMAPVS